MTETASIEDRALDLVAELTAAETRPCSLDHHGGCQEHGWSGEGGCPIPRARQLLAEARPSLSTGDDVRVRQDRDLAGFTGRVIGFGTAPRDGRTVHVELGGGVAAGIWRFRPEWLEPA